jgi:hypothetical protein
LRHNAIGDFLWATFLVIITTLLVLPQTHQVFLQLTTKHPYIMGFNKFGILATMGELFALRLASKTWIKPDALIFKIVIWGLIGILITFMFSFYSAGVSAMMEQLEISPGSNQLFTLFTAFLTSVIMNLTFGIVFMAMHRLSDTYIEMRFKHENPSLKELVHAVQWDAFITFVVFKTIPLFWIPAHTITFVLPAHYRVVVAAYLSIILGVILVYSNRAHKEANSNEDVIRGE